MHFRHQPLTDLIERVNDGHMTNRTSLAAAAVSGSLPPVVLLTPVDAGRRLGLGRTAVFELIRRGELEAVRLNPRVTRVPSTSVDAYIARLMASARNVQAG